LGRIRRLAPEAVSRSGRLKGERLIAEMVRPAFFGQRFSFFGQPKTRSDARVQKIIGYSKSNL
jgi:hypothetical protein